MVALFTAQIRTAADLRLFPSTAAATVLTLHNTEYISSAGRMTFLHGFSDQ